MMTFLEYAAEFVVIYLALGFLKYRYYRWRFKRDRSYPFGGIEKDEPG